MKKYRMSEDLVEALGREGDSSPDDKEGKKANAIVVAKALATCGIDRSRAVCVLDIFYNANRTKPTWTGPDEWTTFAKRKGVSDAPVITSTTQTHDELIADLEASVKTFADGVAEACKVCDDECHKAAKRKTAASEAYYCVLQSERSAKLDASRKESDELRQRWFSVFMTVRGTKDGKPMLLRVSAIAKQLQATETLIKTTREASEKNVLKFVATGTF